MMRWQTTLLLCATTGCYTGVDTTPAAGEDSAETAGPTRDTAASGSTGGGSEETTGESSGDQSEEEGPDFASRGGLRRLTIAEYDNALRDLLDDPTRPAGEFMPADAMAPFDNDYVGQSPSETLIVGVEKLATEAAARLLEDPARLASLSPCTPQGPDDAECLRTFAAAVGRRAFRRPLDSQELDAFEGLIELGVDAADWNAAAAGVVRVFLQDPNFLYRVEIGESVDGRPEVLKLNSWEMATRLSFLLWGTIPDDALLDAAEDDALSTAAEVRAAAELMLADPKAKEAVNRFHSMWLGYAGKSDEGLSGDMLRESEALIERVVFEDGAPWLTLLTAEETFVSDELATHYGLPAPQAAAGDWVDTRGSGRGGLLGQGSVLSLGAKFNDTSPTVRGAELRTRVFCQDVELPEGLEVNVDDPPGVDPDACKIERYAAHRESGACAGCHALTDGLGFGLESYDATGAFRTHDPGKPSCTIDGEGEVIEAGSFNGPGELGAILATLPSVKRCAMRQLYSYASGRAELDDLDEAYLDDVGERFPDQDIQLSDVVIEFAASDAFRFRATTEED